MAQRRHHYERAFEAFLRDRRIPYISVDEARKALLPDGARLAADIAPAGASSGGDGAEGEGGAGGGGGSGGPGGALKSFDFVVYGPDRNLLVEVKGRKVPLDPLKPYAKGHLECWVSGDDTESLARWEQLFGPGFEARFAFIYWCEGQPPDGLFNDVFAHNGRWYAVRSVGLRDYLDHMKPRSRRWGTVHLARADFDRLSRPTLGLSSPAGA